MRVVSLTTLALLCACGPSGINSEHDAEQAYLGLDRMVDKAISLGFDGYNTASSANIDPQLADGELSGTLTVDGQVDQGNSNNKGMRLTVALDEYADEMLEGEAGEELEVSYATDSSQLPELEVQLRDLPDGTMAGSLIGEFGMAGDLEGNVLLSLDIIGEVDDDGAGGIQRTEGTVAVSGSATTPYGVYTVDVQL